MGFLTAAGVSTCIVLMALKMVEFQRIPYCYTHPPTHTPLHFLVVGTSNMFSMFLSFELRLRDGLICVKLKKIYVGFFLLQCWTMFVFL